MKILGIETSCDETAVCLVEAEGGFGSDFKFRILGNALASQAAKHAAYGGVFPNLAKREHGRNLVPMLKLALKQSEQLTVNSGQKKNVVNGTLSTVNLKAILEREPELFERLETFLQRYEKPEVDAIAVTVGPGLEPALWVGMNFARALSLVWSVPVVAVNHMEGHIVVSMIEIRSQSSGKLAKFEFPAIALLISGGHTELILMKAFGTYEYLGRTRDDAVGEAFDKVARMLGLPYPGGPHISRLAEKSRKSDEITSHRIQLPRPMLHENNLDFSFAGLKTAVLRYVEKHKPLLEEMKMQLAREFEDAAADVLVGKTLRAVEQSGAQAVIVGGGVAANKHIREELASKLQATGCNLLLSSLEFTGDNAVMIALAGYFHALEHEFADSEMLRAVGDLKLA